MTDDISNLILEHLRAISSDIRDLQRRLDSLETRMLTIEDPVAALHTGQVDMQHDIAELKRDVRMIKARLELVDAE